jgi:hypothetical protein
MLQFDLITHLQQQRAFSEHTFGPGERTIGVLDHIRKELREIETDPTDLEEWIDVVLLALRGVAGRLLAGTNRCRAGGQAA